MIEIAYGGSQLSGWGHYAEPVRLHINSYPSVYMAGQIIDISETTRAQKGVSLLFSDGTELLLDYRRGLFPPLTDVSIWTEPEEGTVVTPDLDYVYIHAAYVTRKGKVLSDEVAVPVAIPSLMRFVIPYYREEEERKVMEGQFSDFQKTWTDGEKTGFRNRFFPEAKLVVYWTDTEGKLVAVQELGEEDEENLFFHIPFTFTTSSGETAFIMPEMTSTKTITRYRKAIEEDEQTLEIRIPEGEEYEIENCSGLMWAEYKIYLENIRDPIVLRAETRFGTNPVVKWGYFNMPTAYVGTQTVTLNINQHSKVVFKDGTVIIGQNGHDDLGNFWLSVWFRHRTGGGWVDEEEVSATFGDGITSSIGQYCLYTYKDSSSNLKVSNKRQYTCSGGSITWSNLEP